MTMATHGGPPKCPKNFSAYFLRLTKEDAVLDLGCPVVSNVTCFEILSVDRLHFRRHFE